AHTAVTSILPLSLHDALPILPVLNVVGDFDTLSCQLPSCTESGSMENEGENYPADACYTQIIVPNAGHALNLHRNAPRWYRQTRSEEHTSELQSREKLVCRLL